MISSRDIPLAIQFKTSATDIRVPLIMVLPNRFSEFISMYCLIFINTKFVINCELYKCGICQLTLRLKYVKTVRWAGLCVLGRVSSVYGISLNILWAINLSLLKYIVILCPKLFLALGFIVNSFRYSSSP